MNIFMIALHFKFCVVMRFIFCKQFLLKVFILDIDFCLIIDDVLI